MITQYLAEFIDSTRYQDLPENVINQAKLCFLDFLGVSLRGSRGESSGIVRNIINAQGDSTVIGYDTSTPMDAALANGVSAHCLDLDDGHRLAQLHPGACVIPSALALAETEKRSGKEFITAMVVGYQVAIQLGMLLNPSHRHKGFHSTGTCGTIGAAAAASKILDLDKENILNALGLAGTQAAGLLESDHAGSMAKHLHAGKSAQEGVLSALLASEGFTGAHTILEGKEGFLKAMGEINDVQTPLPETAPEQPTNGEFEILRVYFKKYPVCRHLHSSLDAIFNIMEYNKIKITDIHDVAVETYEIAALHNNYHPETAEGFRQSLPLSLAMAIINGNLDVVDIGNTNCEDLNEIASKIRIKCNDDLNKLYPHKRPSKVTIKSKGQFYISRIDLPKGEPETPFTREELLNKFNTLNPEVDVNVLDVLEDLEDLRTDKLMNSLNDEFK